MLLPPGVVVAVLGATDEQCYMQVASSSGQGRVDLQQEDAWSTDAFDFGDIGPPATQQADDASFDRPPSREGFTRYSQPAMRGRSDRADSPRGSQRSGRGGRGRGDRGGRGRGAGNGHIRDSGRQQRSSRGGWSAQPGRGGGRSRPDQGFYSPPGRGNEQPRQDQGFYSVPAEPAASGSADAFWNDI